MKRTLMATAALLLSVASPVRAEVLGDINAWDAQWNACLADPTHVTRDGVYVPQGFYWMNECTITRGPVRYRMVAYTRWWQAFDMKACALSQGLAICRDYLTGLFDCFADYQTPDPFLFLSACTPDHWALWQPQQPPAPVAPPYVPEPPPVAPRYDTEPPTLDRG